MREFRSKHMYPRSEPPTPKELHDAIERQVQECLRISQKPNMGQQLSRECFRLVELGRELESLYRTGEIDGLRKMVDEFMDAEFKRKRGMAPPPMVYPIKRGLPHEPT